MATAPGTKKRTVDDDAPLQVPEPVKNAVKRVLLEGQHAFYERGMKVHTEGEEHIPWNRQTIVAANHASHLDMGLVKVALGAYGKDIVALAAKDYDAAIAECKAALKEDASCFEAYL